MTFIKDKRMRILWISFLGGILSNLITFISVRFIMGGGNEWTLEMGDMYLKIITAYTVIYFVVTGKLFIKDMNRTDAIKSALIAVAYNIIYIIIEQLSLKVGFGFSIVTFMALPMGFYSVITSWITKLAEDVSIWFCIVPSVIAPIWYCIFTKAEE